MLSRLIEEGGTLTQPFIPWSTSGVFITATLGVTVGEYWKYSIMNYVNPLLSIVLAMFGVFILRENDKKETIFAKITKMKKKGIEKNDS